MEPSPESIIDINRLGNALLGSAWSLKTLLCKGLKPYGISFEQYFVLNILHQRHPKKMCIKEIAALMIEKNSNVPRIIEKLLLKNWVEKTKDTADSRHSYIQLTHSGERLIVLIIKGLDAAHSSLPRLEEAEILMLESLLLKFKNDPS